MDVQDLEKIAISSVKMDNDFANEIIHSNNSYDDDCMCCPGGE